MAFDRPAPDLQKLITAWEQFEVGEEAPGRVLANLKTAGLPEVLKQLAEEGWAPALMRRSGRPPARARAAGGAQIIPRPTAWQPGELDAPAAHPLTVTVDDIERVLADAPPARPIAPTFPDARASAVLVALADGEQGAEVLLTRRSRHMRNHKGEISFPGGRMDPGRDARRRRRCARPTRRSASTRRS